MFYKWISNIMFCLYCVHEKRMFFALQITDVYFNNIIPTLLCLIDFNLIERSQLRRRSIEVDSWTFVGSNIWAIEHVKHKMLTLLHINIWSSRIIDSLKYNRAVMHKKIKKLVAYVEALLICQRFRFANETWSECTIY